MLRALLWAWRAAAEARRLVRTGDIRTGTISPAPRSSGHATFAVRAVKRVRRLSCLEGALLDQQWRLTRGEAHDVVVGVRTDQGFEAHAWIDGEFDRHTDYVEIYRRPPRSAD
jgi:hypothetical protein